MISDFTSRVSVIIPCYNAERFVEKAVRSIMEQTYHNLEIICCDDCSSDSTLAILEKLSAEDERIQIIKHSENKQLIYTLNELVEIAGGEYIARMDADDISLPERIEKQLDFMQKNPEIDFCGCNAWHINENDKVIGKSTLPESYDDIKFFLPFYSTFYHPTVFAKAAVLKENPYDKEFLHAEDYELWCRLIFEKGLRGNNLNEKLFEYRINSKGISVTKHVEQANISAQIVEKYAKINTRIITIHKLIFFTQTFDIPDLSLMILQDEINLLKRKKIRFSEGPYKKYMYYLKKFKHRKMFVYAILCPIGIYVIFKFLFDKISYA